MRKCYTCKHHQTATGVKPWCDKSHEDIYQVKYKRCKDYEKGD